jgi:hypothetical protein
MEKQFYSELLKSPKWQKKRLEIMKRDKFACKLCGDTETQLHIHHKEYINGLNPWEYDNKYLITLCADCHEIIGYCIKGFRPENKFDISKFKVFKRISELSKIVVTNYDDKGIIVLLEKDNIELAFCFDKNQTDELRKYLR